MSQASRYLCAAGPNDLSSSRGLTYGIPPNIAHEILHRRIPVLADIMGISVGILKVSKELCVPSSSPAAWRNLAQTIYSTFCMNPFRRLCLDKSDSKVEKNQDLDSEVEPIRYPGPCKACRVGVDDIARNVLLFLVALFSAGHPEEVDRRPYICRLDQIDGQRLCDALAELYDFVKMVSGRKCKSRACKVDWVDRYCEDWFYGRLRLQKRDANNGRNAGNFYGHPRNEKAYRLDDLLSRLQGHDLCDSDDQERLRFRQTDLPQLLEDFGTRSSTDPGIYLQLLGNVTDKLAREMVAPGGISSYIEGTLSYLSPNSCAHGGWSEIYVATYDREGSIVRKVAVKVIRVFGPASESDTKRLSRLIQAEMDVWVLARHPHLLPLYGIDWIDDDPCLISPWCGNGDIVQFVSRHELSSQFGLAVRLVSLSFYTAHLLIIFKLGEVLLGLEYLHTHTPTIVHCDLKGANILVSDHGKALIADFGLAAVQAAVTETSFKVMSSSSPKGTYRWMAWELLFFDDAKPTTSSDIWSFACVVVETLTGRVPYHGLKEDQVFLAISRGEVPARPDDADDNLWATLQQCWRLIPDDRPSARRLRDMIARPSSVLSRERREEQWRNAFLPRLEDSIRGPNEVVANSRLKYPSHVVDIENSGVSAGI